MFSSFSCFTFICWYLNPLCVWNKISHKIYFLGTTYSCWKVLTRETMPVIYYLSPTKWFNRIAFGGSFHCFHSSAKKARESRILSSDGWDCVQAMAGHHSSHCPLLTSREARSSTALRHERFGDVFFFLLPWLFINIGSISSCEREKWNESFIQKVKTKLLNAVCWTRPEKQILLVLEFTYNTKNCLFPNPKLNYDSSL